MVVLFESRGKVAVWRVCTNDGEVKAKAASVLMVIADGNLEDRDAENGRYEGQNRLFLSMLRWCR
jgi:hypothetical protein